VKLDNMSDLSGGRALLMMMMILVYTGLYWFILVYTGLYWFILVYTGLFSFILVYTGLYWYMFTLFSARQKIDDDLSKLDLQLRLHEGRNGGESKLSTGGDTTHLNPTAPMVRVTLYQ